ncbi:allantoate deiminase [Paenibacillus silvae]|uniref:allantoate deiminase n=1 Tax=Paenibacillus silvae TaxID=1325358 RepID=UPI0020048D83|nr:allantoate deiminase [Paenibacillus silvae]MCK6075647.1 allantoate deiminase [Paenibacillus silvae]MCK6150034.1 allantoate deiminase [Paenibacillus silvae]MCK6268332.1 allantoate deiminase [Paenibacillus silvae]
MIKQLKPSALSAQIEDMVEWLASYGLEQSGGVTRLLYDQAWSSAQKAIQAKIEQLGLTARYDDVGNLFGRLAGKDPEAKVILTGSHIDTVTGGGKYDGAFGIVASLLAVEYLLTHHGQPLKPIEIVSLCEEEGSRFPLTYWGSGNITGVKDRDTVHNVKDVNGISLEQAMRDAGFGSGLHSPPERTDLECFIELHIEQGEVLEREGKSIGIVSHIVGQRRYNITVYGESNHAGTTPMQWRQDAMFTAAEMIRLLTHRAKADMSGLVATVGHMEVKPNVGNVIAREVTFSLDVRHSDAGTIEQFCETCFREFETIAAEHGTRVMYHKWMDEPPVAMDHTLNEAAEDILRREGISYKRMTSGAGHDSQIFGTYCPTALLFVPSRGGISHSPAEFTHTEDLQRGVLLLIDLLYKLAY